MPPFRWRWGARAFRERFAPVAGLEVSDPRFLNNELRVAHRDELIAEIEEYFVQRPAEVWLARLAEAGVPAGRVRTLDEVFDWEQTRSQGLLIDVDHPSAGRMSLPGPPRFDSNDYAGDRTEHLPPPLLGQHDQSVRAWLDEVT